jgi:hypothetical protein
VSARLIGIDPSPHLEMNDPAGSGLAEIVEDGLRLPAKESGVHLAAVTWPRSFVPDAIARK